MEHDIFSQNHFSMSKIKYKNVKNKNLNIEEIRDITKSVKKELNECLNDQQPSFGYPLL